MFVRRLYCVVFATACEDPLDIISKDNANHSATSKCASTVQCCEFMLSEKKNFSNGTQVYQIIRCLGRRGNYFTRKVSHTVYRD